MPMLESPISRGAYQVVALATLPLPAAATYAFGRPLAALVPQSTSLSTTLQVLVYALVLLACVLLWAVLLLPLRRRAGLEPISSGLQTIRSAGGLRNAIADEQKALEARRVANAPGYHATFAAVGGVLTLVSAGLTWALWRDGWVMLVIVVAAVVCPVLTVHHAIQWLRFRRR